MSKITFEQLLARREQREHYSNRYTTSSRGSRTSTGWGC